MKGAPPPGFVKKYTIKIKSKDGRELLLRPILPEDTLREFEMFKRFSDESSYHRFFQVKRVYNPEDVEEFTHIDYERDMAIVAIHDGQEIGVGRICGMDGSAEFAIIVEDAWQDQGVGSEIAKLVIEVARDMGYKKLFGEVMFENSGAIRFLKRLGFTVRLEPGGEYYYIEKTLTS